MICAAECVTPEIINFMVKRARGLVCVSISEQRRTELNLPMMTPANTANYQTAFTVSFDLKWNGCTTGIFHT